MTTSLHHNGGPGATPAITVRRKGRLNDDIATPGFITWSSITAPKEVFGISLITVYNPQTKTAKKQTLQLLLKKKYEMRRISPQNNTKIQLLLKKDMKQTSIQTTLKYIYNIR
jgi:hypothetical protein